MPAAARIPGLRKEQGTERYYRDTRRESCADTGKWFLPIALEFDAESLGQTVHEVVVGGDLAHVEDLSIREPGHSKALDMDFIVARDEAALAALTDADCRLPVIFFAEAPELAKLPLQGLRALLDLRQVFGPSAQLRSVTERSHA